MGLETEYSLCYFPAEARRLHAAEEKKSQLLQVLLKALLRDRNIFLAGQQFSFMSNGSRAYLDQNRYLEIATGECSNPRDVARYSLANEALLIEHIRSINERIGRGGFVDIPKGRIEISKKSADFTGTAAYGCHENYQVRRFSPRDTELFAETRRYLLPMLAPFLISRQPLVGAGNLTSNGEFTVSPRGAISHIAISIGTARNEGKPPLAFIRRDGDSNSGCSSSSDVCESEYARLQVCCSDANVSHLQTEIKLGSTAIVLRMIEEGYLADPPVHLARPQDAMETVAKDITLTARFATTNGSAITALELNHLYFLAARKFFEQNPMHGWEQEVMALWEEWLRKLMQNPSALDKVLDWRILLRFVELELERRFKLTLRDLRERISEPSGGGAHKEAQHILTTLQWKLWNYFFIADARFRNMLSKLGLIDQSLLFPQDMENSPERFTPPADTRAHWRSYLARFFHDNNLENQIVTINWGLFVFRTCSGKIVRFINEDPQNSNYIAEYNALLSEELLSSIVKE